MLARGKAVGRDVDLLHADGSLKEARISSTNVKKTQFIHARGELGLRRLTQRNWMQSVVVLDRRPPSFSVFVMRFKPKDISRPNIFQSPAAANVLDQLRVSQF
ncbi:hypothetical protein LWI28_013778 [Acer negundo]|uniref:Uncharacterized protein n=1 Tax=Acer negundo TaxID=4023 RepID=A0AAD5P0N0_ACENE|nr:hypothetical protein LWI28_013778 [Acer negundo]